MALSTHVTNRLSNRRLIELTNPDDSSAASVDTTLLGYAAGVAHASIHLPRLTRDHTRTLVGCVTRVLADSNRTEDIIVARNRVAGDTSNVDQIKAAPFNLTGDGISLAMWDGGSVRASHVEFQDPDNLSATRVTNRSSASNTAP